MTTTTRLGRALVLAVSVLTLLSVLVLGSGCFVRTGPGYNRGYNNRGYHGDNRGRGRGGVVVVGGGGHDRGRHNGHR